MKAKMKKIKIIFFAAVTYLVSVSSYGQVNLKDRTLGLLQSIAFESTYDNIVPLFNAINFELLDQTKNKDKTEKLSFKISDDKTIYLLYDANKKLIYAKITYALLSIRVPPYEFTNDLEANNFTNDVEKHENMFSFFFTQFSKKDYPYKFIMYSDLKSVQHIYIYDPNFGNYDKFIK